MPWLTLFHFKAPGVVTRPLPWAGLQRQLYLVRRRDRGLSVAAQGLYEWVMARPPEGTKTAGGRLSRKSPSRSR